MYGTDSKDKEESTRKGGGKSKGVPVFVTVGLGTYGGYERLVGSSAPGRARRHGCTCRRATGDAVSSDMKAGAGDLPWG